MLNMHALTTALPCEHPPVAKQVAERQAAELPAAETTLDELRTRKPMEDTPLKQTDRHTCIETIASQRLSIHTAQTKTDRPRLNLSKSLECTRQVSPFTHFRSKDHMCTRYRLSLMAMKRHLLRMATVIFAVCTMMTHKTMCTTAMRCSFLSRSSLRMFRVGVLLVLLLPKAMAQSCPSGGICNGGVSNISNWDVSKVTSMYQSESTFCCVLLL